MAIVLSTKKNRPFLYVFVLLFIVTIFGLPLDLIDPDAALYATLSRTIYVNNDFINLYSLGYDWLDKPHLPFWISAIFFKIFGVSNWSYKLPAVLIFFCGVYFTYQFAKKHYNTKVARLASVILASATHSVISNFDVRAEPYLTTFIIASLFYFDEFITSKKWLYLVLGSVFAAFAVMTKGIFALIPLVFAIGGHLLILRKWKQLFNPKWLVAFLLIFIFILPELYTLYIQFDTQPQKIVFGKTGVSGLRFFFWDSQFGRFFNTAPIKGSGDKLFFFHTILWAFLPWGILYYIASVLKVKRNIKTVIKTEEFYTICGSLAMLLIFSLSKFQLPHYTNIIFPLMAILVADLIYKLTSSTKLKKWFSGILIFQNVIVILFAIAITILLQPVFNFWLLLIIVVASLFIFRIYKSSIEHKYKLFFYTVFLFLSVYGFLFTHFYPTILEYQGGKNAAVYVNKNFDGNGALLDNREKHFGFEFYLENNLKRIDTNNINSAKNTVLYLTKDEINLLDRKNADYEIIKEIDNFRVSRLNLKFVNKNTRKEALSNKYLVKIN